VPLGYSNLAITKVKDLKKIFCTIFAHYTLNTALLFLLSIPGSQPKKFFIFAFNDKPLKVAGTTLIMQ
jgi:hypothetical protein